MIGLNREALWQVLRIYDVGGKLLYGIKSRRIDSLACVRATGDLEQIVGRDRGASCPLGFSMYIWTH